MQHEINCTNKETNAKVQGALNSLLEENKIMKLKNRRFMLDPSEATRKRKASDHDETSNKKQKNDVEEEEQENNSFANLPRDIAEYIFSFLDFFDRASLCKVSTGVRKLVRNKRVRILFFNFYTKMWQVLDFSKHPFSEKIVLELISIWSASISKLIICDKTKSINLKKIIEVLIERPAKNLVS